MTDVTARSIVLRFVDYVNSGDLEGIESLLSDEVVFTDSQGRVYQEKGFMTSYLHNFPDYKILIRQALHGGEGVALIGQTSGSHVAPEIEQRETLVWTAEVRAGLIAEWRIYSDEAYAAG